METSSFPLWKPPPRREREKYEPCKLIVANKKQSKNARKSKIPERKQVKNAIEC